MSFAGDGAPGPGLRSVGRAVDGIRRDGGPGRPRATARLRSFRSRLRTISVRRCRRRCRPRPSAAPTWLAFQAAGSNWSSRKRPWSAPAFRRRLRRPSNCRPAPTSRGTTDRAEACGTTQAAAGGASRPLGEKKDLSLLQGCWRLGRDGMTRLTSPTGPSSRKCTVKAGTICFSKDGTGRREATQDCRPAVAAAWRRSPPNSATTGSSTPSSPRSCASRRCSIGGERRATI